MKYDQIQSFEKHIENAAPHHFADLYLIIAKDRYESKSAEETLIKKIQESQKVETVIFQGESTSIDMVMTELNTLPFLAERRIILLQNVDKLKTEDKEKLSEYFEQPNRKATLVMSADTLAANTKFYKKAEKKGVVLDIRSIQDSKLQRQYIVQWIQQRVQKERKTISSEAIALLLRQLGEERSFLDQELEKLICYVGDRSVISIDDINTICLKIDQVTIWKLGEAIFSRKSSEALRILNSLLETGAELIPLIRQIRTQIQREYQICSILKNGGQASQVTEAFPYMKGAILQKHIQMAENFGIVQCKKALMLTDETELEAKNGNLSPELLAERLILKMII